MRGDQRLRVKGKIRTNTFKTFHYHRRRALLGKNLSGIFNKTVNSSNSGS
ncbi:hypothetical protein BH10ACT10_BH10ACT10_23420 [soil metagenome]